jgi:hypothetical protein
MGVDYLQGNKKRKLRGTKIIKARAIRVVSLCVTPRSRAQVIHVELSRFLI